MGLLQHILLGLLQGVTEFLPVSSSAHLVAARTLLGVHASPLFLEVCLHFGTLVSILLVFRSEIWRLLADAVKGAVLLVRGMPQQELARQAPSFGMAAAIVAGTIPAAVVGLCCRDAIGAVFEGHLQLCGVLMMVTGLILLASRYAPQSSVSAVGPLRGLVIGMAQAVALLPGISRSGSTIVAGYFAGLERPLAARFSFLLGVPAMAGAMVLVAGHYVLAEGGVSAHGAAGPGGSVAGLIGGTVASAVAGAVCLVLLLRVIQRGKLHWFAAYCVPVGALLAALGTGA